MKIVAQDDSSFSVLVGPQVLSGHTASIRCSFYMKGDKQIVSSSDDKTIRYVYSEIAWPRRQNTVVRFLVTCWSGVEAHPTSVGTARSPSAERLEGRKWKGQEEKDGKGGGKEEEVGMLDGGGC